MNKKLKTKNIFLCQVPEKDECKISCIKELKLKRTKEKDTKMEEEKTKIDKQIRAYSETPYQDARASGFQTKIVVWTQDFPFSEVG